jgi:hypothetical protein
MFLFFYFFICWYSFDSKSHPSGKSGSATQEFDEF